MSETNCENCGAPIDTSLMKCPYCETPYPGTQAETYIFYADNIPVEVVVRSIEKRMTGKERKQCFTTGTKGN